MKTIVRILLCCSGLVLALLLSIGLKGTQTAAEVQQPSTCAMEMPYALADTGPVTVYLPLVSRNCRSTLVDEFSDPGSGWPVWEELGLAYGYDNGVYKITDWTYPAFFAVSPDWMVPNDSIIAVDAWSEDEDGAFGLIFGLGYWEGTYYWRESYAFLVDPAAQQYELQKIDYYGDDYEVLASGTSGAIGSDATVPQTIEVRRTANTITLVANGTVVDAVIDATNPYTGRRSVGLATWAYSTAIFDDFEVRSSGCITTPLDSGVSGHWRREEIAQER